MSHIFLGIDGGGTGLRAALVRVDGHGVPTLLAAAHGPSANPNTVGHDVAAARVHAVVRGALAQSRAELVAGVGVGIAGAAAAHSAAWLRTTLDAVLPGVPVVASADHEIALVGALGVRQGVLLLAGTGSVVYGVNAQGVAAQVGGWGYLLGDEGSGFWLGRAALTLFSQHADGLAPDAARLAEMVRQRLGLTAPRDVVAWLYRTPVPVTEVAALAVDVLALADDGDDAAQALVAQGASALAAQAYSVMGQLGLSAPQFAFAGGLLTRDTALARALCARLQLAQLPQACHTPVVGAALLAHLTLSPQALREPTSDAD